MDDGTEQPALFTGGTLNPDGRVSPIQPGDGTEGTPEATDCVCGHEQIEHGTFGCDECECEETPLTLEQGTDPRFDATASARARDAGMARVQNAAPVDWITAARRAVVAAARTWPEGFTADDVVALIPSYVPPPPEPRAMGPVLKAAQRDGLIEPTPEFRNSIRVSTHRSPRRVWRAA